MVFEYFKYVRAPLVMIFALTIIYWLGAVNILPSIQEISAWLVIFFDRYGLVAVAVLSLIENIVGFNAYFPGSIVILTAMAMTYGDPVLGTKTFLVIFIFALIAYNVNYFLGNKILSSGDINNHVNKNNKFKKRMKYWFFSTFWHPHFASITSLVCGSENVKYKDFILNALLFGAIWNVFWALMMYNFGSILNNSSEFNLAIYIYLIVWLLVDTSRYLKKRSRDVEV